MATTVPPVVNSVSTFAAALSELDEPLPEPLGHTQSITTIDSGIAPSNPPSPPQSLRKPHLALNITSNLIAPAAAARAYPTPPNTAGATPQPTEADKITPIGLSPVETPVDTTPLTPAAEPPTPTADSPKPKIEHDEDAYLASIDLNSLPIPNLLGGGPVITMSEASSLKAEQEMRESFTGRDMISNEAKRNFPPGPTTGPYRTHRQQGLVVQRGVERENAEKMKEGKGRKGKGKEKV